MPTTLSAARLDDGNNRAEFPRGNLGRSLDGDSADAPHRFIMLGCCTVRMRIPLDRGAAPRCGTLVRQFSDSLVAGSTMYLQIERPTREPSATSSTPERMALDGALRAFNEAVANSAVAVRIPPTSSGDELRNLAQNVAQGAVKAASLTSESPLSALHSEHSGWGLPVAEAPGVPWEILAADVLDFLASLLGSGDRLMVREDS